MCQPRESQQLGHGPGCSCGCCGSGSQFRRFYTTEEELDRLKSYKDELEKDLAGVQERISQYKG